MTYREDDDGLGSFNLSQLGMKTGTFGGAHILKFERDYRFVTTAGELIESTREFVSLGLVKAIQKFVGKKLINTTVVGPHDDFPDVDAMNASAPQEEWGFAFGKPQGPYGKILVLKLLDDATMERYAFVTKSIGGSIAIGDLTDKIKIRRRLQGPNVTPVISCRSTLFRTSFNPNDRRPHFVPLRWIELKGDAALAKPVEPLQLVEGSTTAPIVPEAKPAEAVKVETATAPTMPTATSAPIAPEAKPLGAPVTEPALSEEIDDKIVF
jgi:hypothetical protein